MTTENRLMYTVSLIAATAHLVIVHSLMVVLGYPSGLFYDTVNLFETSHRIIGVLLLVGVPVALLVWVRLIVPTMLVSIGFICVIISELGPTSPEFVQLGDHILIDGTAYIGMYATGWSVWLLAAILGGLCEFVVRTRRSWSLGSPVDTGPDMPLNRSNAALLGVIFGVLHTVVFAVLAIERERMLQMESVLIWGLIGGVALGGISVFLAVRILLLGPLIVFGLIVVATGVEALSTIVGIPVSSYFLYWPVYFGIIMLIALVEYLGRVTTQKVATYRRSA